jgi:hypothetical protein
MAGVFICYRRDDSAPYAGRVFDRLAAHFGSDHVFLDVDAVAPGQDFVRVLHETLQASDAVVVLIGRNWLAASDEQGKRRLDLEGDYVRQEIAMAIGESVPIVPVLVGRAGMPKEDELPEALAPLARRQAIEISDARFHQDVDRLIEAIGGLQRTGGPRLALRSEAGIVSSAQARVMVVRHDFYCLGIHEAGKGISNEFESQVAGDAVVVLDRATGLMWEKGGSAKAVQGTADLLSIAEVVSPSRLAGSDSWRLPTLEEAMSILSPKKHGGLHLDPVFEQVAPFIWTADRTPGNRRWLVYYSDGSCGTEKLSFYAYIRLVRDAAQ